MTRVRKEDEFAHAHHAHIEAKARVASTTYPRVRGLGTQKSSHGGVLGEPCPSSGWPFLGLPVQGLWRALRRGGGHHR